MLIVLLLNTDKVNIIHLKTNQIGSKFKSQQSLNYKRKEKK